MPHAIPLPTRLDVDAACTLWEQVSRADGDLLLDAAALGHLGAAGLQVLLAAQRRQQALGHGFALINVGPDGMARLAQMGATHLLPTDATGLPGGAT